MEYERPTVVEVSVKIDTTTYQGPDGASQCSSSCCWGEGCSCA